MRVASPSTTLYTLGKGILSIAEWSGGAPGAYVDVGNCPKFDAEVTETKLDHFSSRTGTRTKDKTVIIETGYKVAFDLDEKSAVNMAMLLKGRNVGGNIYANTELTKEYALRFVSDNPAGPNERWFFHRCTLSPGGAVSLIGDEWQKMSFNGEGLSDTVYHASSPYFTVALEGASSTTTTTF